MGNRFEFARGVSGPEEVLNDADTNLIVIGTRHNLHAGLTKRALEKGKHVFVEKPLAMNEDELAEVITTAARSEGQLMVGFNRRFSPLARAGKEFFARRQGPLSVLYRVSCGRIARDHWTQDPVEGGGRIIGEVCHFIDLIQFWTDARPVSVFAETISGGSFQIVDADSAFISLRLSDGSNACIAYLSEGDRRVNKERVEIFGGEKTFILDDFRCASFFEKGRERQRRLRAQDKGQAEQVRTVCDVVRGVRTAPISLDEIVATSRATFRILKSIRTRQPQEIMGDE